MGSECNMLEHKLKLQLKHKTRTTKQSLLETKIFKVQILQRAPLKILLHFSSLVYAHNVSFIIQLLQINVDVTIVLIHTSILIP